jgi:hypothetical protein
MNKLARRWELAVSFVVWSLILVFVAGFSVRQGLVLALILAWLTSWTTAF